MYEIASLFLIFSLGLVLGSLFFGGLWWTVHRSVVSENPAFLLISSLLVRMGVTLGGFYLVLNSEFGESPWQRLLLCLMGFVIARLVITRITGGDTSVEIEAAKVTHHAP